MIKEYAKIKLKTGEVGRILEVLDDDSYMAEIVSADGDIDTTEIRRKDIAALIVEVEQAI